MGGAGLWRLETLSLQTGEATSVRMKKGRAGFWVGGGFVVCGKSSTRRAGSYRPAKGGGGTASKQGRGKKVRQGVPGAGKGRG